MSTQAGWYADVEKAGQERYWDGTQWSDQRRAAPPAAPTPPVAATATPVATATPAVPVAAPEKKKHTTRNVILAIIGVFVLLMGGCTVALVVAGGNAVNDAVEADKAPGGPDNPMEIQVGEAFEVQDFNYASGWTVTKDALGDATIKGLKVTNNRDDKDSALVEIKFWSGTEVLALVDCTTSPIDPGTTVTVSCISGDKLPSNYDEVTINDTF